MRLKIQKIKILPAAKMLAAIHAAVGFVVGLTMLVGSWLALSGAEVSDVAGSGLESPPGWIIFILPIVYGVAGGAGGAALTWLYNLISPRIGGLEIETE